MGPGSLPLSDRARLAHLVRSTSQHVPLTRLAREHGWTQGAEIGVLKGKTLFALLDACPGLHMIGIDAWVQRPLRADENAETYVDFDMAACERMVRERAARFGGRCTILKGDTVAMADQVADASLDFVFIDADHTEAGVRRDIAAWVPKVRAGGMALGHDLHWTTVRRAIDDLCPGWQDYGEAVWGAAKA